MAFDFFNLSFLVKTIVDYDMAAIALAILLYLSIYLRHLNKSKSSKVFRVLLIVVISSCLINIGSTDIINFYVTRNFQAVDHNFIISKLFFTFNFLTRYSILGLFLIYVLAYTQSTHRLLKSWLYDILIFTPFFVFVIALIINWNTGIIFSFKLSPDGDLIFTRGLGVKIMTYYEVYYLSLIIIHVIRNWKVFEKYQILSLLLIVPVKIITIVMRIHHPTHQIELLGVIFCMLFIVQTIESPELLIDSKTGLNSSKQFQVMTRRRFIYKDKFYVIFTRIINFAEIYSSLSYEEANSYINSISRTLETNASNKEGITFVLSDGMYAILFDKKINIDTVRDFYIKLKELNNSRFFLNVSMTLVSVPDDFKNETEFQTYIENFHNTKKDLYYDYSEVKNDRDFLIDYNIETLLEEAFKKGQFRIYYQPIFNVEDNKLIALEALSRIYNPKYGIIEPDSFIKYSEKRGSISNIDLFVFESVLKMMKTEKINEFGTIKITINISMIDFNTSDFIEKFVDLTTRYNADTSKIKLEITETNEYRLDSLFFAKVQILRNLGYEFILDDYGTGYSNLEKFAKLPMDYVKLDKNLIKLANKDEKNKLVLKTTFDMIHDLDRYSIIEGIETKEELNEIIKYGCNYVQGNYFSKPLEIDELYSYLEKHFKKNLN